MTVPLINLLLLILKLSTVFLVKVLKFKHLDMKSFFSLDMKNGLLSKSIQNPEIYHKEL